ncbi:class I SAM-dependent methyltransferase [Natranaerobius trueperi]|uniref:Methyltransferase domain-containing protein n=1 Tax=Natranaerobius trueperi TaxID=759412 RepID=A0A226C0U3_9FIRM|nr:class I SAM-dependent methyltransferase [Natranaerobius trueperi]OWZ84883.1 hypothetical protein CDO51_00305 [Natranaerobius trueperi]
MSNNQPENIWSDELFTKYYLDMIKNKYPANQTEREANFIESVTSLFMGDKLLDLCSGCGRHALAMAKRGYNVTGVELSEHLINKAEKRLKDSPVTDQVSFINDDVTKLHERDLGTKFRAAYTLASLGYYMSDEDVENTLKGIYNHLESQGFLIVDVKNREHLLRNFKQKDWVKTKNGFTCFRYTKFDFESSCTINYKHVKPPHGDEVMYSQWMRAYTLKEMFTIMTKTGFSPQRVYGNFKRGPYDINSQRMIVVATKES